MAERVPFPTSVDGDAYSTSDLTWAEDPGANAVTKPATARFEDGYYEGTGADDGGTIPAEEHNSLFSFWMKLWAWIVSFIPREWAEMSEGIAASSPPERFVVHAPAAGLRTFGSVAYSQQGPAGAYAVRDVCTDGQFLYIAQLTSGGVDKLYNADPDDGQPPASGNWSTDFGCDPITINRVACDGDWVWVACTASTSGLKRVARLTGAYTNYTGHGSNDVDLVACNGEYTVCVDDTNPDRLHVYQQDGTYDGYYSAGASVYSILAVCVSGPKAYFLAVDSSPTTPKIGCVNLSTRAADWTSTWGASPDITAAHIACDGRRIYVGHTRSTIGGTQRTLTCFRVDSGAELWTWDDAAALDGGVYVDNESVWFANASNAAPHDKITGDRSGWYTSQDYVRCGDGVSLFGYTTNNITRYWLGRPSVEFQRCAGTDGNRVPWSGMLAVPTKQNL